MITDATRQLIEELKGSRTQVEFAALLGIRQSTLSLILAGKRNPNIALVGLMRAFPHRANEIAAALAGQPLPEREPVAVPA
jgi:transcriptional regulator with XRE-family HTH domain